MWMWIVGIVLVAVAGVLFLVRRMQAAKRPQESGRGSLGDGLQGTPTSQIAQGT